MSFLNVFFFFFVLGVNVSVKNRVKAFSFLRGGYRPCSEAREGQTCEIYRRGRLPRQGSKKSAFSAIEQHFLTANEGSLGRGGVSWF